MSILSHHPNNINTTYALCKESNLMRKLKKIIKLPLKRTINENLSTQFYWFEKLVKIVLCNPCIDNVVLSPTPMETKTFGTLSQIRLRPQPSQTRFDCASMTMTMQKSTLLSVGDENALNIGFFVVVALKRYVWYVWPFMASIQFPRDKMTIDMRKP